MQTQKVKRMLRSIEDAMVAASFAEQGEATSARSIMQEGRAVLLGLKQGHIEPKTLKYALNTAKRIDAKLDILYVSEHSAGMEAEDPALTAYLRELSRAAIGHRLIRRAGCLRQQIIEYTNTAKEIAFAVIESPQSLDADCARRDRTLAELWQELKCPLVVVMDAVKM